jgi:hypothetical protein
LFEKDEYVPPSAGDNFVASEEVKAINRPLNITFFSTLHGNNAAAGSNNNDRRLRTSISLAFVKAEGYIFSIPQVRCTLQTPPSLVS